MTIDEAVEIRREQARAIVDAIEKTENENSTQYELLGVFSERKV